MASPKEHLLHWLNDAHSMEKQAVESTENQLHRLENYPQLRAWVNSPLTKSAGSDSMRL